ncbi:putative bifunctional diguanylate cyclase/phosphodiesterase [Rugamonas rubra]|uniref:PAS domain S-box-containing protein/diguanylate cyclase (GGDEF) domain-containing protein n=1 Tax=Rugamonas rubra TaxID=758825 RepID=A0A1I4IP45_9BURK|nr:EAL domain-containing protein [Rugamonas rubra]SFL56055.1 PAS domain S-box-containing protein/diguanylate cyclase (GGDEF) domain-containing protein [Rugamonas rubra]
MPKRNHFIALVTASYVALALLWILLSDRLLLAFGDLASMYWLSQAKGIAFVAASATGYFFALRAVAMRTPDGQQSTLDLLAGGLAPSSRPQWSNYLLALVLTAAMLFLRAQLGLGNGTRPLMILFMFPIILSALLGGAGPGLLATAVAAVWAKMYVVAPLHSLAFDDDHDLLQWVVLLVNGAMISVLSELLRGALVKGQIDRGLINSVVSGTPDAIFVKDLQGRYLMANDATTQFVGRTREQMLGRDDHAIFPTHQAAALIESDRAIMAAGLTATHEELLSCADGREVLFHTTKGPVFDKNGRVVGLFGISRDVTERRRAEEKIEYLAHFDALTGLPNRVQLAERAGYAISLAQRNNEHLALMFLDLDHFKDVNDTLGHSVGDAVLVGLAKRLLAELRVEDTVSRLGGDEFILLVHAGDARGLSQVVEKVLALVARPHQVEQHQLTLTGSIGIALYPADGKDLEELVKCADAAMYRAKKNGRNGYCFFTAEMQARTARHMRIVGALRQALRLAQLAVHYQPQFAARDGRIVGAEALLRWQHPELGTVSPAEFIPAAEESGLILELGEWVLRTAVRQAKDWMDAGMAPLVMAVNLSAVQFRHPNLPDLVRAILREVGLAPEYLELELTESGAMQDPPSAIAVMNKLREQGVRMSIDDFGTGYSSLSYLKKFKVYKLKIDQSFVRDISTDPEDKAIVVAIINMAKGLGLQTIAEGVETPAQLEFLRQQGCDEMQGYHYSRPLPAAQFEAFARARCGKIFSLA